MTALPIPRRVPLMRFAVVATLALVITEAVALHDSVTTAFTTAVSARPWWLAVAAAATMVSMASFARTQRRMLAAATAEARAGISMPQMLATVYAANAVNMTLPGGSALSVAYLVRRVRTWGVSAPAAAFALVASGLLSSLTFAGLVLTGALMSGHPGYGAAATLGGALVLGGGLVVARRAGPRLLDATLRRATRAKRPRITRVLIAARQGCADLVAVHPRRRDWAVGSGFAALNWVADLACLVACGQAVGVPVAKTSVLVTAYLAGMAASSISVLPGGFGTVEVAMVLALTSGGVPTGFATAVVAVYRVISCVLVVGVGWLVWWWTRRQTSSDIDDQPDRHRVTNVEGLGAADSGPQRHEKAAVHRDGQLHPVSGAAATARRR